MLCADCCFLHQVMEKVVDMKVLWIVVSKAFISLCGDRLFDQLAVVWCIDELYLLGSPWCWRCNSLLMYCMGYKTSFVSSYQSFNSSNTFISMLNDLLCFRPWHSVAQPNHTLWLQLVLQSFRYKWTFLRSPWGVSVTALLLSRGVMWVSDC